MKHTKKYAVVISAITTTAIILVIAFGFKTKTVVANDTPSVTVADLQQAGYTNPTLQLADNNNFIKPNLYFRVDQTTPTSSGWGTAGNLVAVLVEPKLNPKWQYNKGQMKTINMNGKTQVRFSTSKNYIVITGPDSNSVLALARNLTNKF